jgi:hypothetical protein
MFAPNSKTERSIHDWTEFFSPQNKRNLSIFSPMIFLPYLAATILSLISFHTTYYGMRSFYGLGETGANRASRISDPIANSVSQYLSIDIENLFAICFAAVVQGGILVASAYLFHILLSNRSHHGWPDARKQARWLPWFVLMVLLLLLPISIVFSYGARLEWQIGAEQKIRIQASGAHSDATAMLNTLKGMVAEESQRRAAAATDLAAFKDWIASMEQLTKAVAYAPEAMQAYLKSVESVDVEKRAAERTRAAQVSQQTLEFERQADLVKEGILAIDQEIRRLEPLAESKIPALMEFDARIAQFEVEMKKEQEGTGSCGAAGEGSCFRKYKAQRDQVALEKSRLIKSAEVAARTAGDRLTELKKQKINKEVELANIVDKAKLGGYEIRADPTASMLDAAADLPKKITDLQLTVGQYGIELKQALDLLRGGFTPQKYSRVVERCRSLLPITQIGNSALSRIECDPAALSPSISAIVDFQGREEAFSDQCGAIPPHVGSGIADDYTAHAFEKVSKCIELSGLGASEIFRPRIADLSESLSKSISNRSSGVDYLTFTTGELRDGKRVAFLALFFAFAVDALVLVFTFLGELARLRASRTELDVPLSSEERRTMFADFQMLNDAIDTGAPANFPLARSMLTCLQVGSTDGIRRLDFSRLADETDRQALRRRLVPFLASGLAWDDPNHKHVVAMSERAMSMLTQECRRVMALEERAAAAGSELSKRTLAERLRGVQAFHLPEEFGAGRSS